MSFVVYCRSRRPRNRRTLAADIRYSDYQKGTKFGILIDGVLLYITTQTCEPKFTSLGGDVQRVPRCAKIVKGVKICNAFLVHHLADSDEIWHG